MSNRKKYESHARADEAGPHPQPGGTSKLLQRLLRKIAGADDQKQGGEGARKRPAGHRSGSGADSVAPYLDEARNTRPGPLE